MVKNKRLHKNIFSIIVPCFNGVKTIERTLLSLSKQSFIDFEVIIINDASTDQSLDIIKKITSNDKRFKILNLKKNKGLSGARNEGLVFARGKYICFLDADDWWPSKKLEVYVKYFNEGYNFLYSDYTRVNEDTGKRKVVKVLKHLEYIDLVISNPIPVSSAAFDSEELGKPFFTDILLAEDWLYWLDLFKKSPKSLGINKNLMYYSVSSSALSANKFKMASRAWHIFRSYHKFSFIKSSYSLLKYFIEGVKKRL